MTSAAVETPVVMRMAPGSADVPVDLPMTREAVGCPACGADPAEPVAVGDDFERPATTDSVLALRCLTCGLVYLNRPPANDASRSGEAADAPGARLLLRLAGPLRAEARVLDVGCGDGTRLRDLRGAAGAPTWRLDGVEWREERANRARDAGITVYSSLDALPTVGVYDLVLLVNVLETIARPAPALLDLRAALLPAGRVVVVTPNAGSAHFRRYQGRHWGGYDFPRRACLYDDASLATLATRAGFEVLRRTTLASPVTRVRSARNLAADWHAPSWVQRRLDPRSRLARVVLGAPDHLARLYGQGSALVMVLAPRGSAATVRGT